MLDQEMMVGKQKETFFSTSSVLLRIAFQQYFKADLMEKE